MLFRASKKYCSFLWILFGEPYITFNWKNWLIETLYNKELVSNFGFPFDISPFHKLSMWRYSHHLPQIRGRTCSSIPGVHHIFYSKFDTQRNKLTTNCIFILPWILSKKQVIFRWRLVTFLIVEIVQRNTTAFNNMNAASSF